MNFKVAGKNQVAFAGKKNAKLLTSDNTHKNLIRISI